MFKEMFGRAVCRGFKTVFSPDKGFLLLMLSYLPLFLVLELSPFFITQPLLPIILLLSTFSVFPLILYIYQKNILDNDLSCNYYPLVIHPHFRRILLAAMVSGLLILVPLAVFLAPIKILFAEMSPVIIFAYVAIVLAIVFFLFIRIQLIIPHASIGNSIEIKKMFRASKGYFWVLFSSVVVVSIPATLLSFALYGNLVGLSRDLFQEASALGFDDVLGAFGRFVIQYLSLAPVAALAELYKGIVQEKASLSLKD